MPFFGNNGPQILRELALLSLFDTKLDKARHYIGLSIKAAQNRRARYEYAQSLYALYRIERYLGAKHAGRTREESMRLLNKLNAADIFFRLECKAAQLEAA
ncbi:MAG TPA: hypothetical protein PLP17_08915 [Oligoflexia bacterium]|nr:hypothetical protein [Oligoflexia bacterium]